jgi:MFS family permease
VAASGLNVVVRTILVDGVTLKENAKNWAIFAIVSGVSYIIGPVVGGYLSSTNWRWCFGINLPIGAVALLAIFLVLRKELLGPQPIPELGEMVGSSRRTKFAARLQTIDIGGQVLFLLGFGLIVLALTWGGVTYAWDSAPVLVSLMVGVLLSTAFFIWERMLSPGRILSSKLPKQRPMIPWAMVTNRDVGIIFYNEIATGMALFSVGMYFVSLAVLPADKPRSCFFPAYTSLQQR